jgi:hypothetical protein
MQSKARDSGYPETIFGRWGLQIVVRRGTADGLLRTPPDVAAGWQRLGSKFEPDDGGEVIAVYVDQKVFKAPGR